MPDDKIKILDIKDIYTCPWLSVGIYKIRRPDGSLMDHHVVHYHRKAVGIVPVTDDGKILLVRTYRFIPGTHFWETPGGGMDDNESPEETARRELLEETGYEAGEMEPMFQASAESGVSDQVVHTFIARGIKKVRDSFDTNEISEIRLFEMPEILDMMQHGVLNEVMSMLGLLYYNTFHRKP